MQVYAVMDNVYLVNDFKFQINYIIIITNCVIDFMVIILMLLIQEYDNRYKY